jgi:hypothetical protein
VRAGQSVELVLKAQPVAKIVHGIADEANVILRRLGQYQRKRP